MRTKFEFPSNAVLIPQLIAETRKLNRRRQADSRRNIINAFDFTGFFAHVHDENTAIGFALLAAKILTDKRRLTHMAEEGAKFLAAQRALLPKLLISTQK